MTKRQIDYIRKLAFKHKVNFQIRKDQRGNYLVDLSRDSYPITVTVSDVNTAMVKVKEISQYRYEGTTSKVEERFGMKY